MQIEANILERITRTYTGHRAIRPLYVLAVLSAGVLLIVFSGGFPPWAWRLLLTTLPQISALLALRGSAALLAIVGLVLLSLTILLAWWMLLWLAWRMLTYWSYERRELRNFAVDMQEAQYLAQDEGGEHAPSHASEAQLEEDDYASTDHFANQARTGRGSMVRRRRTYSLAPVAREAQRAEIPDHDYADEAYNDDEAYKESDKTFWPDERMEVPLAPTQSARPVRLVNTLYEQESNARPGPRRRTDNLQYTNYGLSLPLACAAPVEAPRLYITLDEQEDVPTLPLPTRTPVPAAARQPAIQLIVSTGLDVGLKRKDKPNEDSLLALQNTRILRGCSCPVGLFVIADGMGGHGNGQEASRLVVQSLSKTVVPSIISGPSDDNYAELLAEGVHHANLAVYQRNRQEKADMGTTLAAALIVNTTAYIANVGDSRVYLYRASSGLTQVTHDHSTVARLVAERLIEPDEIYTHPRRNEIYRSLGHHPSMELDKFMLALQPEDLLLLCSDGLWEMVRDPLIQQTIVDTLHQPTQIGDSLVQAALAGGGKDNISVIVVSVKALEEVQATWAG